MAYMGLCTRFSHETQKGIYFHSNYLVVPPKADEQEELFKIMLLSYRPQWFQVLLALQLIMRFCEAGHPDAQVREHGDQLVQNQRRSHHGQRNRRPQELAFSLLWVQIFHSHLWRKSLSQKAVLLMEKISQFILHYDQGREIFVFFIFLLRILLSEEESPAPRPGRILRLVIPSSSGHLWRSQVSS